MRFRTISKDGMLFLALTGIVNSKINIFKFSHSEDLLTLRDFSEPALLHTLRVRFSRHESYTAVGTILVSVNPYSYHNYEQTYGESIMDMYVSNQPSFFEELS